MEVKSKKVGFHKNSDILEYEIINDNGMSVSVLNLGGIITKIKTKDRDGVFENVVLAYENIETYFENPSYYGAVIGRTAGRIAKAKVMLHSVQYDFAKNYNPNTGHGGMEGFDKKIWGTSQIISENEVGIKLRYESLSGEEGYPGTVDVEVNYILNNDDEFIFNIIATTDKDTLLNVTNHSYFNLSGNYKRDITSETLRMNTDKILAVNETNAATGELIECAKTPFDFSEEKAIGKDILVDNDQLKLANGYDHAFLFGDEIGIVELRDYESGRGLTVTTDQKAAVIYTTNFPDKNNLENGKKPRIREAICIETQSPPISENMDFLEDSILKVGEKYNKTTRYKFYNF